MDAFGRLGSILGANRGSYVKTTLHMQLKARLKYAKESCDLELRNVIDGLDAFVEQNILSAIEKRGAQHHNSHCAERGSFTATDAHDLENKEIFDAATSASSIYERSPTEPFKRLSKNMKDTVQKSTGTKERRPSQAMGAEEQNETRNHPTTAISEDLGYPMSFILTIQDLVLYAQTVMDTSLEYFCTNTGACADIVFKIQAVGLQWDDHRNWPCRSWFVRLLLSVAALNRVIEWWEIERGFWSLSWTTPTASVAASDTEGTDQESISSTSRLGDDGSGDGQSHNLRRTSDVGNEHQGSDLGETPPDQGHDLMESGNREYPLGNQNSTIVMELELLPITIRYVSHVWADVIGTDVRTILGTLISQHLARGDESVFQRATDHLRSDYSKTIKVQFNLMAQNGSPISMEGNGMLMYDRLTALPSHTMWVVKPLISGDWSIIGGALGQSEDDVNTRPFPRTRSLSLPAIEKIPYPAQGDDLSQVDESDDNTLQQRMTDVLSPSSLMSLPPLLCRICERWVVAAFFEQHSALCLEIHQSEMELVNCNDSIGEFKHLLNERCEVVRNEIAEGVQTIDDHLPLIPDVKLDSDDDDSIFGDDLPLEEEIIVDIMEQKREYVGIYEELIEILDVALSISTPGRTEEETERQEQLENDMQIDSDFRKNPTDPLQSPSSKEKMFRIFCWRPRSTEHPEMLSTIKDVEMCLQSKIDSVNRMRDLLEYNICTRAEFQKQMQQEAGWTEFVTNNATEEGPNTPLVEAASVPKKEPVRPKKSLLSRLTSWRTKSSLRNRIRKGVRESVTPKIAEVETIATPFGSPSLKPSKLTALPVKEHSLSSSVSGNSTPSSQSQAWGKSPMSPLQTPIASRPTQPSIKDFDIIKPISKGAFGSVFLAKKRTTGDYYAVKFLKKSDMIAKNQVTNVKAERMILMTQIDSPFVTKLYYTFQSKDYLYLVLEYLNGGDCSALVKNMGRLPEDWARTYLAEVTLGLEHLQSRNVVHRDLKPENLLIGKDGHLKLTDFGLSRVGFLDRRQRDELTTPYSDKHVLPSSPAPSPTGSPIDTPVEETSTPPSSGVFRQSFFNMLFDKNRRSSVGSSVSGNGDSGTDTFSAPADLNSSMRTSSSTPPSSQRHRISTNLSNLTDSSMTSGLPSASIAHRKDQNTSVKHAVGTPDYLAPESILGTGLDSTVDWWALGVICYEFLYGIPPFHDETPDKVFENILSRRINWYEGHLDVSAEARDFMERLLTLDPDQRLGSRGAQEVKQHPFFKGVAWDTLMTEERSFIPQPENQEDTEYFDARGATMPPMELDEVSKAQVDTANAIIQEQNPEKLTPPILEKHQAGGAGQDADSVDFGTFTYKNLPVLEKANEDAIRKMRNDSMSAAASGESSPVGKTHPRPQAAIPRKKMSALLDTGMSSVGSGSSGSSTSSNPSIPSIVCSTDLHGRSSEQTGQQQGPKSPRVVEKTHPQGKEGIRSRARSLSPSGSSALAAQAAGSLLSSSIGKHTRSSSISSSASESVRPRPLHCLVVDDNPISCKILETILLKLQCRCEVVCNGEQAIRSAMSNVLFDIIFMDMRMPIIDGETAARMIKSTRDANYNTPIIAVTTYECAMQSERLFVETLSKPVTKDVVQLCLKRHCRNPTPVTDATSDPCLPSNIPSP